MIKQFIDLYKEVGGQIAAKSASMFNAERDEAAPLEMSRHGSWATVLSLTIISSIWSLRTVCI